MDTKECKACGEIKYLTEYYKHPAAKDERAPICKECAKAYSNERARKLNKLPKNLRVTRFWDYNINPISGFVIDKHREAMYLESKHLMKQD